MADARLSEAVEALKPKDVAAAIGAGASEAARMRALRSVLLNTTERIVRGFSGETRVESVTGDLMPVFVLTGGLAAFAVYGAVKLLVDKELRDARAIAALLLESRLPVDDDVLLLADVGAGGGGGVETEQFEVDGRGVTQVQRVSLLELAYMRRRPSSALPRTDAVYERAALYAGRLAPIAVEVMPRTTVLAYAALRGDAAAVRTVLRYAQRTNAALRATRYTARALELFERPEAVFSAGELAVLGAEPPPTGALQRLLAAAAPKRDSEQAAIDVLRELVAFSSASGGGGGGTLLQSAAEQYSLLHLAAKYGLAKLTRYVGEQLSAVNAPGDERSRFFKTRAAVPAVRTDKPGLPTMRTMESANALQVATEVARVADARKQTREWAKAVRKCVAVLVELYDGGASAQRSPAAVAAEVDAAIGCGEAERRWQRADVAAARRLLAAPPSCDWCDEARPAAYRCSGCRERHYCSAACQRRDWLRGGHACGSL